MLFQGGLGDWHKQGGLQQAILDFQINFAAVLAGARWGEKENWGCNAGLRVDGGEHYYDGVSVHPMEV